MHVTKKHALIYHAWYNYPQISSQDYEVLAAQGQLFFCGFWQERRVVFSTRLVPVSNYTKWNFSIN